MKRRLTAAFLSVAMMLTLVACGGGGSDKPAGSTTPSGSAGTTATVTKDNITFAYEAEPPNLSTTEHNAVTAFYLNYMLYSGLFKYTANGVEKDLCTDYYTEKDADGVESIWVFKIREGVKFSDGTDLTAQDVVDTLNFARERPTVGGFVGFFTEVELVDDYTIKMHTDGVYATVPKALCAPATFVLPSELIASGHDFSNNPVGSGPYKFVKWNKGENIELTANEYYYGNTPAIKNVNWKFMAEGTSRTIALEAGEIDFVISVPSLDIPRLEADDRFNISISNGSMFTYMLIQGLSEPFQDINFRKFLASAINRDDIIAVALDGYATPLTGCINVNIDGYTDENACAYDPEAAQKYLEAWGGDPASVNFDILVATDVRRRIAEVIQGQLEPYGVNCTISTIESAVTSSVARSGEYEAMIFAYTTNDFATYARNLYYVSDEAHPGNKYRMSGDDSLNSLIDDINATTDDATREKMITDFTSKLNAKQPVIPIYCSQNLLAYDKNLKGVEVDNQGFFRMEDLSW